MEMKDKLVKFGHKRGYYLARRTFVGFLSCVCLFSVIAIPTYIATKSNSSMSHVEGQDVEEEEIEEESFVHI